MDESTLRRRTTGGQPLISRVPLAALLTAIAAERAAAAQPECAFNSSI